MTSEEREAVRLRLSALNVLSALNRRAKDTGVPLEDYLKQHGPAVFQRISPIPQVTASIKTIATSFALVDEEGEPDHRALFENFDAIFRNSDGPSLQPTITLTPLNAPT